MTPLTRKLTSFLKSSVSLRTRQTPTLSPFDPLLTASQAEQIAYLLNQNNKLRHLYNKNRVLDSRARYFPEHIYGLVLGSIGVLRVNFMLTEVKHLVVHSAFRRLGLARYLLGKALLAADTPVLFATIRTDNEASLSLFKSFGFKVFSVVEIYDHNTALLLRKNELY